MKNPVLFHRRFRTAKKNRRQGQLSNFRTRLTIRNGIHSTAPCNQVGPENSNKDCDADDARPPANQIADEIDLLLSVVLCPKADAHEEEWPVDGITGVRMRCS
jgi:hypothetical protein